MSNIYHSISDKLAVLNIDIYHYEDIVRCYVLAKLNIEHSRQSDYADGIHTVEFAAEVSQYQLLPPDVKPYYVRCSARELTNAARILFQSIKIKAVQMASISEDLQDQPVSQKDSLPFEDRKDPTAYLFHRNFGTHLHILGLSEPEMNL